LIAGCDQGSEIDGGSDDAGRDTEEARDGDDGHFVDADVGGDADADADADADPDTDADGEDERPFRGLLTTDGYYFIRGSRPFFWLADDAWALHNRATLEQARSYLDARVSQGYTVIHTWLFSGWMEENLDGHSPFLSDLDNDGPVELDPAFFDHVGEVVGLAAERDLYLIVELGQVLRMSPSETWLGGFDVDGGGGDDPSDHEAHRVKAYDYGWQVAEALKSGGEVRWNLIFGLGQDTHPERGNRVGEHNAANGAAWYIELVRAVAEGLADATNGLPSDSFDGAADYSTTFMGFHTGATGPEGGPSGDPSSTSEWFHDEAWLDYHSHQSGRRNRYIVEVHELMAADVALLPPRPTVEAEIGYEDAPILDEEGNRFSPYDMRVHAYWAVFSGGAGHQYGHLSLWQLYDPELFSPRADAYQHWEEIVEADGAIQMDHLRRLIESRPILVRVPDQTLLAGPEEDGGPHTRLQATRARDGSYAFVYATNGRDIEVDLSRLSGDTVNAWWYDPRAGESTSIGSFPASDTHTFDPPEEPSSRSDQNGNDWVLVLDDAARGFPEPATRTE
jgi:hypothetical protein